MEKEHGEFLEAVRSGNVAKVRAMAKSSHRLVYHRFPDDGYTALSNAVAWKRVEVVKLLLSLGADPRDSSNSTGRTPLWDAIENMDVEMVKLLLRVGARRDWVDRSGELPAEAAWHLSRGKVGDLVRRGDQIVELLGGLPKYFDQKAERRDPLKLPYADSYPPVNKPSRAIRKVGGVSSTVSVAKITPTVKKIVKIAPVPSPTASIRKLFGSR